MRLTKEKMIKIINVIGARPNFIKISPLLKEMKKYKKINPLLLHTGQHYDFLMSDIFLKDLGITKPDINLNIGPANPASQVALIIERFAKVLMKEKPDLVLVVGDVNSTLACALAANKMKIKIAHVEAGMRSFDRRMPEEINRILTDQISDFLFTVQKSDHANLEREGISKKKIYHVGNIMADTLIHIKKTIPTKRPNIPYSKYAVLTLHRQENVDQPKTLKSLFKIINDISREIPIFFPVHPRTKRQIATAKIQKCLHNIHLISPMGYLDFFHLYSNASFVMTDSGGLQAETSILNIPCLTLRENTEWTSTLSSGTNLLVGHDEQKIKKCVNTILIKKTSVNRKKSLWDGKTAERIVKILNKSIS